MVKLTCIVPFFIIAIFGARSKKKHKHSLKLKYWSARKQGLSLSFFSMLLGIGPIDKKNQQFFMLRGIGAIATSQPLYNLI